MLNLIFSSILMTPPFMKLKYLSLNLGERKKLILQASFILLLYGGRMMNQQAKGTNFKHIFIEKN